ncbi:antitoxin VapB [Cereibacter changlensis]|uniref:Antitoxin VapB n=1 Tax=Cereibacter changlensis TaxID=402884 RepID=A0A2W7QGK5_9RHOB|nr:type II toxin-antitoxin system VapB family antitoxin [Cereibacter changlensis]PZX47604.1 antitoxin VapB [Cereibacter changlensis]
MPLYIRDDAVNDLAERLAALTGENKTQAVRSALEKQIEALQKTETLHERVARIQARARAAGIVADGGDDKALMDDLSGGL